MDRPNRLAIDDICDILVEVRDRAHHEGYGLLQHLINEAFEEARQIRASINEVGETTMLVSDASLK
ncbi:hypothetical protein [Phyllobacterium lublinensis]|uniref:hypothetical protein n=1 Tax=Phyllobacterium lublinensis TaxID=2875708 RepID=UPI001CCF17AB|nr:hypothetical protein [Phyllobacterium sp. 2063]MBZ9656598.1 hypothetical protein [Phyllobacterium sp. 2063]